MKLLTLVIHFVKRKAWKHDTFKRMAKQTEHIYGSHGYNIKQQNIKTWPTYIVFCINSL